MKVQILAKLGSSGVKRACGMKILSPPNTGKHNFKKEWLEEHSHFITKTSTHITLHTVDGDVNFKIDHMPGRYCLTTGVKLPDASKDPKAEACRAHVAAQDNPVKTDRWPHGYMVVSPKMINTTMEQI
mgnify:CR=1 FL=1|jgi:hypothetical protein|tara:strand:+ start:918 stop:1301 length:384 start_codon:yes stop_codon:yes gene_type:complete